MHLKAQLQQQQICLICYFFYSVFEHQLKFLSSRQRLFKELSFFSRFKLFFKTEIGFGFYRKKYNTKITSILQNMFFKDIIHCS